MLQWLSFASTQRSDVASMTEIHLMNEVALHRGREPHLTVIDAFVEGRHLTQAIVSSCYAHCPRLEAELISFLVRLCSLTA